MAADATHVLRFLDTTVRFDVAAGAAAAFAPVHRFFRHLFDGQPGGRPGQEPTFRVAVHAYDPATEVDPAVWQTPARVIRRSTAPEFCFDAHVVDGLVDGPAGRRRYVNRATLLDVPRDAALDPVFAAGLTSGSTIQVIDFVRDLVIRHQEALGTVVLHASGVTDGEAAVVIAGRKGAGKTTTLLSALRRPGWRYFTGDKLFCRLTGTGVEVHPWRDYPYVGVGTILAHPDLAEWVRRTVDPAVDGRAPTEKLLLDPDAFESWLGAGFSAAPRRLAALLLPEVRPGEPLRVTRIDDPNERWAQLNTIVDRQADTTFFTWQSYLVPDYTAFYASLARLREWLDPVPMVRLTGTLDVDPGAVLAAVRA